MHPNLTDEWAADLQREWLRVEKHARLAGLAAKGREEMNARIGRVDRSVRLRGWLANQLTWPRWPRRGLEPL
jgi:hypothetical protein